MSIPYNFAYVLVILIFFQLGVSKVPSLVTFFGSTTISNVYEVDPNPPSRMILSLYSSQRFASPSSHNTSAKLSSSLPTLFASSDSGLSRKSGERSSSAFFYLRLIFGDFKNTN